MPLRITMATGLLSNKKEWDAHIGLLQSEFKAGIHAREGPSGKWWIIHYNGSLNFVRPKTPGVRALGTMTIEKVDWPEWRILCNKWHWDCNHPTCRENPSCMGFRNLEQSVTDAKMHNHKFHESKLLIFKAVN